MKEMDRGIAEMCIGLMFLVVGCQMQEMKTYSVRLISPNGEAQQEWVIRSIKRPHKRTHWGGQTRLQDTTGDSWWESEIVAPAGWALEVTEVYPR